MAMELPKYRNNGRPIALESMLNSLLGISDLKSWSIYQNDGGLVNINIRFCNIEDDNISEFDMPASYRKVSANQLKRSRLRAQDHKAQNMSINNKPVSPRITRSKTTNDSTTNKKRKMDSPPEYNRELSSDQSNIGLNIDTPVSVKNLSVHTLSDSPLLLESTPVSKVTNNMTNEVPFYHGAIGADTFWDVVSQSCQTVINQTDSETQTEKANDGIDVYSQTENSQNVHPSKSIEIFENTVTNTNICETSAPLLSCTYCGKVKTFLYKYYVECRNLQRKGTCDCCIYYCEPCKVEANQPDDEWLLLY